MKWAHRKRGGQEGWAPTQSEMKKASSAMFPGDGYVDLAIPVPGFTGQKCEDDDCMDSAEYWETSTGNHGWACGQCGMVVQWG